MENWNFTPNATMNFALAADARLIQTDYTNDQIWQLSLGNSEPPALSMETTFGLRARLCRIFPRFMFAERFVNDPALFAHPVIIHQYFPDYICLSFKPFSSINVRLEYWVPSSQIIACRTKLTNTSHEACRMQVEWAELLLPDSDGTRMTVNEIGMVTVLSGKTADLFPLLFVSGGAQAGKSPYPALNLEYTLAPLGEQVMHWVHASSSNLNASYEQAKSVINRNWDAEIAQRLRMNSRQVEIITGNKDWDHAFRLSQTVANQLLVGPTRECKHPSLVLTRKPDQGFSRLSTGSDYNYLWNGQTALDVCYLANFLLPAFPELFQGLLENFLSLQTSQGEIDWKPGLGGQLSRLLATPLLAGMTLQWYEYTQDADYLNQVFPKLNNFYFSWFSKERDRDRDQFPEWEQLAQTGFDDLPLFSQHDAWSVGVDISTVESPDLASYLFREGKALISIASIIKEDNLVEKLEDISSTLKSMLESAWSDQQACYLYRDRNSHLSPPGEILGTLRGSGVIDLHREFQSPIRPLVSIKSGKELTHPTQIFIHGNGVSGAHRVEHLGSNRIHWQLSSGFATSDYPYRSIERIEIIGLRPEDEVSVKSMDFNSLNQSLLLPLWAGIPSDERAKILVNLTVMNKKKFLGPFGLRSCLDFPGLDGYPPEFYGQYLPWTDLVLEGLVQYGARKKAAMVFSRLMKAAILTLEREMALFQSYNSETGKGQGTKNCLNSLIPAGLFLKILGVKIYSPTRVEISGYNPFPWPVTVKYQGLTIVKQDKKSLVIFPDGQSITVDNEHSTMIRCE